jgi:uncharacterized protein
MEKELVEYIANNLVNDPEQVRVNSKKTGSSTTIELHVASEDMGRVIGKQGRVANAIRSLLRVIAVRDDTRITLEID